MSDDEPSGDNKADDWSLSCLVKAAHPPANTATDPDPVILNKDIMTMNINEAADDDDQVINVEYLLVSSRGTSVTEDVDPATTGSTSKRKRGDPWSEMEHRQFLQGLQVHGKGKWKKISRDFVKTRTPVQVASHAQKFFDRRNSLKPKKRKSINDIISFPALVENITPLRVYNPNIFTHHAHQPQPMISQVNPIFGNCLVPATTHLSSPCLDSKMQQLPCYASYPPQGSISTSPHVQVNVSPLTDQVRDDWSMVEPQLDPPFPIIDQGMYRDYCNELSGLEELLPPL